MPQIKLKAKLQAYSRAPFYGDYIRQPKSILDDSYNPDTAYVLKDGSWIDLNKVSSETGLSIDELRNLIIEVEEKLLKKSATISCKIDNKTGMLLFTNSLGQDYYYSLPAANVDGITVGKNDSGALYVIDKPDDKSIKVVDVEYEQDPILGSGKKLSGKLRVDAIYTETDPTLSMLPGEALDFKSKYLSGFDVKRRLEQAEKNIRDIEGFVQGTGGFLDPNNFGRSLTNIPEEDKNEALNSYAYSQLFNGQPQQLPDQTKVKNTYTGNIWVYVQETNNWVNEGQDTIVTATNDGVLGSVTGVEYDPNNPDTIFKISIEKDAYGQSTGIMTVNGLSDALQHVVYDYNADVEASPDTYVKRSTIGTIKAQDSVDDLDVINQGQFNDWQNKTEITSEEIFDIVNALYFPEFGDSDGDGDIDIDWKPSTSLDNGILGEVK